MRFLAAALTALATAALAVGTPLCCLAELSCCADAKAAAASEEPHCPCCPAERDEAPAKKRCDCPEHGQHALLDAKESHGGASKLCALPVADLALDVARFALAPLPPLRPVAPAAAPAPLSTPLLL